MNSCLHWVIFFSLSANYVSFKQTMHEATFLAHNRAKYSSNCLEIDHLSFCKQLVQCSVWYFIYSTHRRYCHKWWVVSWWSALVVIHNFCLWVLCFQYLLASWSGHRKNVVQHYKMSSIRWMRSLNCGWRHSKSMLVCVTACTFSLLHCSRCKKLSFSFGFSLCHSLTSIFFLLSLQLL